MKSVSEKRVFWNETYPYLSDLSLHSVCLLKAFMGGTFCYHAFLKRLWRHNLGLSSNKFLGQTHSNPIRLSRATFDGTRSDSNCAGGRLMRTTLCNAFYRSLPVANAIAHIASLNRSPDVFRLLRLIKTSYCTLLSPQIGILGWTLRCLYLHCLCY